MVQTSRPYLSLHARILYLFWCPVISAKGLEFLDTGKSFSEALILASTNPQYEKKMLRTRDSNLYSEHVVYINCSECKYV